MEATGRAASAEPSRCSGAKSKTKYQPLKHRAEKGASRCSPSRQAALGVRLVCWRDADVTPYCCGGSPVILFPLILMYFFHSQLCGVCWYESALPSTALPLHPSQHPLHTRKAGDLTGGQEAFANAPFNAHFSKSNGGIEGKSKNCRNCSFHFLWFHNFVAYQF